MKKVQKGLFINVYLSCQFKSINITSVPLSYTHFFVSIN